MLTVFTTPKPFEGITAVHQRNAIGSWLRLPGVEVLVLESDRDIALGLGVRHFSGVDRHESGLPYVNSLFKWAEIMADHDLLVYANADLVLLRSLTTAVERLAARFDRFLAVGQRWDVELDQPLDFGDPMWEDGLRNLVQGRGSLHSVSGKDWFAFRRPLGLDIPPFVVGRVMWDNWLLDATLREGIPVVDVTGCVTAIHPDHGYPDGWLWDGLSEYNRSLCDVPPNKGRISEATWEMKDGEIIERK